MENIPSFEETVEKIRQEVEEVKEKLKNSEEGATTDIVVQTLTQFRVLLEIAVVNKVEVEKMLAHENAHSNVAEIVGGTHEGYALTIEKKAGDHFRYTPHFKLAHPNEWDNNDKIDDLIRVFNAPKEYGGKNSGSDDIRIARLEEQKKRNQENQG